MRQEGLKAAEAEAAAAKDAKRAALLASSRDDAQLRAAAQPAGDGSSEDSRSVGRDLSGGSTTTDGTEDETSYDSEYS
jgi:hypothetical protein